MAKEVNKRVNVWLNSQGIEDNLKSVRSAITKTTNELQKIPSYTEEWYNKAKKLQQLKSIYADMQKEIKTTGEEIKSAKDAVNTQIMAIGGLATAAQTASFALKSFISTTQEYVEAFATLDDAISAVQKTTGMTREEVETLNASLKQIDTRTSNTELLKIAEIGGRMGIAKDQILGFTEAVNKANVALGDSFQGGAEEISSVLGKIALAYKETRAQDIGQSLTQIGSALNEVGASANATEGNIAAFVQRVGSMPEVFRPTVQQAVALGAAFEESSIDAEVASRAFGIVMMKASTNVEAFARVMKQPADEIRELINTNPAQFFVEFAESLKGLQGTEVGAVLKDLKLNADGVNKIIGAMSTNTERFTEILNTSNTAFSEAISLDNEYATVNNNAAAQLEKAKNKMQEARAEMGENLIPVLTLVYQTIGTLSSEVSKLTKWLTENKLALIGLGTALGSVWALLKSGKIYESVKANMIAVKALNVEVKALGGYLRLLGAGGLIAGVTIALIKGANALQSWSDKARQAAMHTSEIGTAYKKAVSEIKAAQQIEKSKLEDLIKKINNSTTPYEEKVDLINQLNEILPDYYDLLQQEGDIYIDTAKALQDLMDLQAVKLQRDALVSTLKDTQKQYEAFMAKNGANVKKFRKEMLEASDKVVNSKNPVVRYFYKFKSAMHTSNETFKNEASREAKNFENIMFSIQAQIEKSESEMQQITNRIKGKGNGAKRPDEDGNKSTSDNKETQKQLNNFNKRLEAFRKQQSRASLEGWAQIKQGLMDSYQEFIDEATKLGKTDIVSQLITERDNAIQQAGVKYLRKVADMMIKFKDQAESILHPDKEENVLLKTVAGTQKEWDDKLKQLNINIAQVQTLLEDLPEDDEQRKALEDVFNTMLLARQEFSANKLAAISDTIKKYTKSTADFITTEQKAITNASLSETEREKAAINERFDLEKQKLEEALALRQSRDADDPEITNLQKQLELLEEVRQKQLALVGKNKGQSVWEKLFNFDWSTLKENWLDALNLMSQGLQEFANATNDIFNSIQQIQSNRTQAELQEYEDAYNEKTEALQKQLNSGLISQKKYDTQIEKLNKEKEAKEKKLKHEQFAREKTANIIQATITGIMAAMQSFKNGGGFPYGLIPMAISAATTAAQIAVIASQPNPYAKGGYIRGAQMALMGEAGDEWVASNKLLQDKRTASVIAALDAYQNGKPNALANIQFATPTPKILSQNIPLAPRNFAGNNTTNNYYSTDNSELLTEIKTMNRYLSDPRNRQAYITRKTQLEFDEQEQNIREMAKL